ncbi:MAG: phosphatase PAP2 family protein [Synergistaceae bacterium]|nr:phosphatase PAP2 family protein [Synergistaceae bacterium]
MGKGKYTAFACFMGLAAVLLAVGTFFDLPIDEALYDPQSAFGNFFAAAGMVPLWTLLPFATGFLWGTLYAQMSRLKWAWLAALVALALYGTYVLGWALKGFVGSRHLYGVPWPALVVLTLVLFAAAVPAGVYLSRRHPDEALVTAVAGVVAIAGGRYILDHIKVIWGRQRFFTMTDPAVQFTPWYQPAPVRAASDSFMSFPSGHSLGAWSTLWLAMFPPLLDAKRAWTQAVAAAAAVFAAALMVSRMVLGMHFLSDVTVGAVIFVSLLALTDWLMERYGRDMLV